MSSISMKTIECIEEFDENEELKSLIINKAQKDNAFKQDLKTHQQIIVNTKKKNKYFEDVILSLNNTITNLQQRINNFI